MVDEDKERFGKSLAALFLNFNEPLTTERIHIYWLALNDLPIEMIEESVLDAIRGETDFLPKPAKLREFAGVGGDAAVFRAFATAQAALPIGQWKTVCFRDRVINATIRNLGGWPDFIARFNSVDGAKWVRHEFCKAYTGLSHGKLSDEATKPLAGNSDDTAMMELGIKRFIHCVDDDGQIVGYIAMKPIDAAIESNLRPMLRLKQA
jgi:hypothetical protein